MSQTPDPRRVDPAAAAALLGQADRSIAAAQDNAGWLPTCGGPSEFGLRWILALALWCVLWVLGLLVGEARPWAGAATAVGIMTVTVGGAVRELRR